MSDVTDHEALDLVLPPLRLFYPTATRESECVEFRDPADGKWYEVVVREIARDDEDDAPGNPAL